MHHVPSLCITTGMKYSSIMNNGELTFFEYVCIRLITFFDDLMFWLSHHSTIPPQPAPKHNLRGWLGIKNQISNLYGGHSSCNIPYIMPQGPKMYMCVVHHALCVTIPICHSQELFILTGIFVSQ